MAYSYKGSISFGLVYIPITLHNTIKDNIILRHIEVFSYICINNFYSYIIEST